jgi:glycosyltransferase involved in cell wall biosynthesis
MRVLILVTEAFNSNGGIAQFNRNLIAALSSISKNYEILVLPRKVGNMDAELTADNILHCSKASKSNLDYVRSLLEISTIKFDLVICGHVNLLPVAHIIKSLHRAPLILIVHGIDVWSKHKSFFIKSLINKVDFIWSVSKVTRDRMISWSGISKNKFSIIPNTIDLELYKPGDRSKHIVEKYQLNDKKVVMFLGRLSKAERYKGVDEIIECATSIIQKDKNIRFLILGDGDDKQRLEDKASSLGLAKYITFTGFIKESKKILFYRSSDLFVMPGKGEGFGIVYLEALACGIPVVGSLLDGSREALMDGKLGKLVNPNNHKEITQAILEGLHSPTRISRAELNYFSLPSFTDRVKRNIETIIRYKLK